MPISMNNAKANKIDEFYTLLPDVEEEIRHYSHLLYGKTVYCCCDVKENSSFFSYFYNHFDELGLKKLICTGHKATTSEGILTVVSRFPKKRIQTVTICDGSFENEENLSYFLESDYIITNPPFSKAKKLLLLLIKYKKLFLLVCNRNVLTSKYIFPHFLEEKIKISWGFKNNTAQFRIPSSLYGHYSNDVVRNDINIVRFRNVLWLTNIDVNVPHIKRTYTKNYNPQSYPKYDNYNAINVDKISDIPCDYFEEMGVPITFLDGFDKSMFELVGLDRLLPNNHSKRRFCINGKEKYVRIVIKRKSK